MWKITIVCIVIGGFFVVGSLLGAITSIPEPIFPSVRSENVALPLKPIQDLISDAPSCWHNDIKYPEGSTICKDRRLLRCVDGKWQDVGSC